MDYFEYFNNHPSAAPVVAELPNDSDVEDWESGDIVLFV